jgi:recombination protein RecA
MVKRYRAGSNTNPSVADNAFLQRKEIMFLSTGCTLLNCIIGFKRGGWPFGRMVNIIGDKSTGKTLLAEEAIANLFLKDADGEPMYPGASAHYRETESAFDLSYAQALGVDVGRVDFGPQGSETHWRTIEQVMDDLRLVLDNFDAKVSAKVQALKKNKANSKRKLVDLENQVIKRMPVSLYIIDSLDALSSEVELDRDIHEGSYGLAKQKIFGELCRTEIGRIKRAKICLMIISQTRDRIGPMIRGKKYRRHCDKVLDFYASAVIYLADLGKVYETRKGIKRPVAIRVKAKADKNKIAMPFRECVFELRFGYGIDDEYACLDYLKEVKRLGDVGLEKVPDNLDRIDITQLKEKTVEVFLDVEGMFLPLKPKYAA